MPGKCRAADSKSRRSRLSRMSRQPQLALLGEATLLSLPSVGRGVPPSRQSSAEAARVPRIVTSNFWPREATTRAPRDLRMQRPPDLADVRRLKSEVLVFSVALPLISFWFRVSGFGTKDRGQKTKDDGWNMRSNMQPPSSLLCLLSSFLICKIF